MCQFCNPNQASENLDIIGNERSYAFFSIQAIEEAIRQTSGGCTPICDHHRSMLEVGALGDHDAEDEEDDQDHNGEDCCNNVEDYDGT